VSVPYYESQYAQEEVVGALERNEKSGPFSSRRGLPSDLIDSAERGARAGGCEFLELNFQPFLKQDGLEFGLRPIEPVKAVGSLAPRMSVNAGKRLVVSRRNAASTG
jgi:hypothetical protein